MAKPWKDGLNYTIHLGYSIGGTLPVGMPAEIRSLNSYTLCPNLQLGIRVNHIFKNTKWGVMSGLTLEQKGMIIDAAVKNYHITFSQGGQEIEGQFTGNNYTKETQFQLTLPITATFNIKQVSIYAGVYGSWVLGSTFEGYAYNGYLRRREMGMEQGDPTGAKIEIGETPESRGNYNFSDDMRKVQAGIIAGADWVFSKHWGAYLNVTYGFSAIHRSSFKVLDQKLHPMYGTIGVVYKMK
ncbi:MAG: PorT family protein [Bacteroidaceae bacterium]|nr:PorT family protein [Bacteroidaceae bacterium]